MTTFKKKASLILKNMDQGPQNKTSALCVALVSLMTNDTKK